MAHQALERPQIGPRAEHVHSKRMAKAVAVDVDTDALGKALADLLYRHLL
ncbi:MAG TPA: hypothetical protein VKQ30_10540 [Ktedonobacterales bacterium]|nr:hypothetical protein [Ktedonobacterales bacterium]